jgi:GT2 family glycosyltransferase/glycosyltransferase involved in cell wall biosynthesis
VGLFVIGTPRSGALLIAQALAGPIRQSGGTACLAPDPIADAGRPHPLTAANDELLAAVGGSWLVPPPLARPIRADTSARRAQAASSLRSAFGDRPWIWSDPRLLLTLEYWLEAAPDAEVLVLPGLAEVLDGALSDERGLPAGYGAALQRRSLRHVRRALGGREGAVIVDGSEASQRRAVDLIGGLSAVLLATAGPQTAPADIAAEESAADTLVFDLAGQMIDHDTDDRAHIENLRRLNADAERRAGAAEDLPERLAAAEMGAAETAADFEQFKQRRSISAITNLADRFYPAAQKLRSRLGRSSGAAGPETDASAPAVTVVASALGAAARRGDLAAPLTVIVPVYNAPDEVGRCIAALAANTPPEVAVLFVNDGSSDRAIAPLLEAAVERTGWSLLTNEQNLGFTRTVNRGLEAVADGDVILLNADTRVGPKWTWRLRNAVYSEARYGTATPLSDNAGAFSFQCVRPTDQAQVDAVSTAVARGAVFVRPEGPTGNGFCMYIPARSRALVPQLDAEAFPRGYGEENDFCMKLVEAGLTHVIADDVVVFHDESASFGPEKQALLDQGLAKLAELWPDYHERVQRFLSQPAVGQAREAAASSAASAAGASAPPARRVLFVSHDGQGGTQHHCDDLARALQPDHEIYLLTPAGRALSLKSWAHGSWQELQRWHPAERWSISQFRSDEMTDAMADLISRLDIDLVHVHHLIGQTFDIVEVATAMAVPVVVTAHDYYLACPALNLLDEKGQFCGGTCTPGQGNCQTPEPWVPRGTPLKHNLVHPWQAETTRLLSSAAAIVVPANAARQVLADALDPALVERIEVIEHGLDVGRSEVAAAPYPDGPVKVLVAGAVSIAKGSNVLRALIEADTKSELAFEVLGQVDPLQMKSLVDLPVRWHGSYDRQHFPARLARIRPSFVAVLSVWPETYNYVVAEAWAAGVPVVAGTLGAPGERVARTGAGLVVDLADPSGAVAAIVAAARDERRYNDMVERATTAPIRSTAEMARDYRDLYSRCLAGTGALAGRHP